MLSPLQTTGFGLLGDCSLKQCAGPVQIREGKVKSVNSKVAGELQKVNFGLPGLAGRTKPDSIRLTSI